MNTLFAIASEYRILLHIYLTLTHTMANSIEQPSVLSFQMILKSMVGYVSPHHTRTLAAPWMLAIVHRRNNLRSVHYAIGILI
jgi:hypothetical protein